MMARPFEEIVVIIASTFEVPINDEVKVPELNDSCTIMPICS
jgi:hypothetical protein